MRIRKGLSQGTLARLSELDQGFISALEGNRKEPGAGTIMALCRALDVTPNELLMGSDNEGVTSHTAERSRVFSGAPWEREAGYCRAIRVGDRIDVAGTTAVVDGDIVHPDDPFQQTLVVVSIIKNAIEELGGRMADVVRMRIFVTDADYIADAARAFRQSRMHEIVPVMTAVVVKALVNPHLVIEIEAEAIVQ